MNTQIEIAEQCLKVANCDLIRMTFGTPYHVGPVGDDWEYTLCAKLKAQKYDADISAVQFRKVNGRIIDMRHQMGSSRKTELRATQLLNQRRFNEQWYIKGIQPLADIILRAHAHWGLAIYDTQDRWTIAMPPLMTLGDRYGARRCDGTVDYGIVDILISKQGNIEAKIVGETLGSQMEAVEGI